uniref:ZSWIM1/3 RNaseH-like domain-containing protein n=1 Tax=Romanomermis culicivorax TaxID=13658 RepID=A0A915ITR4_ROMCU
MTEPVIQYSKKGGMPGVKKEDPGAYLNVLSDDKTNAIDIIFFQNSLTHQWFSKFPELVEVNGTVTGN